MPQISTKGVSDETKQRQRSMAVLAKARSDELEKAVGRLANLPGYTVLRAPEPGLVMVQGRASGTGDRFNLGEMTVTRCSVQTGDSIAGHAYVAGRNFRHAELAALVDAMLQSAEWREAAVNSVIEPLALAYERRRRSAAEKAGATRVDFFTMVRGDNVA